MPLVAHWPGVIAQGQTCDALVGLNDFMATFAELTGVKLEKDQAPDSISFANLLKDPKSKVTRKNLILQSVTAFAVRDGKWKLCVCPGSGSNINSPNANGNDPMPGVAWAKALAAFNGKLIETDLLKAPFVQLFNVAEDPHEDKNLAAENPKRVSQMIGLLKEQIQHGRSTSGAKLKNDKNVRIVNPRDRRLPDSLRHRLSASRSKDL